MKALRSSKVLGISTIWNLFLVAGSKDAGLIFVGFGNLDPFSNPSIPHTIKTANAMNLFAMWSSDLISALSTIGTRPSALAWGETYYFIL